ncbi:unnamed protein product [Symbiodinium natans]|uniref:Uncharacterized protein n=1 Tax=Symbiodinium natans TaxID=878477 RepID=A0A812PU94_9DINO|nr:unnamed protein product [Symbiodinium natans]
MGKRRCEDSSVDDSQTSIHRFFAASRASETVPVLEDSQMTVPASDTELKEFLAGGVASPTGRSYGDSVDDWELRHIPAQVWPENCTKKRKFEWHSQELDAPKICNSARRRYNNSDSLSQEPAVFDHMTLRPTTPSSIAQPCLPAQAEANNLWPIMALMCSMMQAMQSPPSNMSPVAVSPAVPNCIEPCPSDDFMTETLGDCAARWKRLLLPDASGRMPDLQGIISLAACYPKPPQRALYSHSGEVKRLLAQDGSTTIGILFKPDGMSSSVAVYLKSGKVIVQGKSLQDKVQIEKMIEPWTQMWPLGGVAARRAGAAFSNLPSPEMARAMAANTARFR